MGENFKLDIIKERRESKLRYEYLYDDTDREKQRGWALRLILREEKRMCTYVMI